jgi:hypothetical protein
MRLERHAWTISRHIADPSSRPAPIGRTSIAYRVFRVFGLTKMRILVAAHNRPLQPLAHRRLPREGAQQSAESGTPRPRRTRKKGTWTEVISAAPATGRGPPAG